MPKLTEDTVEIAAIEWFQALGYTYLHGGAIAPDEPAAERATYRDVWLFARLRAALARINTHIPQEVRAQVIEQAVATLKAQAALSLLANNRAFQTLLTDGVDIRYTQGGNTFHNKLYLLHPDPAQNDWLVVNQFTVQDVNPRTFARTERRPDIVVFVNGLPLAVLELKNPADDKATLTTAFQQLNTYQEDISPLFVSNALLVVSDGVQARLGTLGAGWEWFKVWRTVDGTARDPHPTQLQTLIEGVFAPSRFLDLILNFIVFEENGGQLTKKLAQYHQFHAVNKAVESTLSAIHADGDQRAGVVWHTQGSGKSLSMLFYAGKVIRHPRMENPTLIVLTDRNDLDDQLFGVFATGQSLLRQQPVQAESREHLQTLLKVASGGVVFTTIQKFRPDESAVYPILSTRRNIVFIADEAHRSQYGFEARLNGDKITYGFAKYVRDALPNASFIGFTGTPIESTDVNTRQVFGDYIDIYDIQRAVDDGATVPIYYQGRLARLHIKDELRNTLDAEFDQITESQEDGTRERLKSKWAALEAMVGTAERIEQVATDIIVNFEERQAALVGKGMIVTMSRRIAVDLYDALVRLRPDWHDERDEKGKIKVVMTGSAGDPAEYQAHIRNKARRKALAERFKNPSDDLELVIVRDMWLTGFDAPILHTLYVDKPMQGHGLMQAIARVNRVFKDKPGGLVVDYLGIAADLQEAVQTYTREGGLGVPANHQTIAINLMQTKFEDVQRMLRGFDYQAFFTGNSAARLNIIPNAIDYILGLNEPNPKKRFVETVTALNKAFVLAMPDEEALKIRDTVALFQAIRASLVKLTESEGSHSQVEVESAIKQLVSRAIASDEVIDIFATANLPTPNIGILSDEFLDEVSQIPQRNLAVEMLQKLLRDEVRIRSRQNLVQARSFESRLDETIQRYQNRSLSTQQVIDELIAMAQDFRNMDQRGKQLNLDMIELAFYDALAENQSALEVLQTDNLAVIAVELVKIVRNNATIDWTVKETARANMRKYVKRILRKYGYPPDLQDKATQTVLEQAELLAAQIAPS